MKELRFNSELERLEWLKSSHVNDINNNLKQLMIVSAKIASIKNKSEVKP